MNKMPYLRSIILADNSHVPCKNKQQISLAYLYLVKHRKTWYTSKFGAVPYISEHEKYIKRANVVLDKKIKEDFQTFFDKYIKPYLVRAQANNFRIKSVLQDAFEHSNTIRGFILKILENSENDCSNLTYWFDDFMAQACGVPLSSMNWKIDIAQFASGVATIHDIPTSPFHKQTPRFYMPNAGGAMKLVFRCEDVL
jgi:hypothetical protein